MTTLAQERLRDILDYDAETGVFTWRVGLGNHITAGRKAGKTTAEGYISIKIEGRYYRAHRLAFLYMTGQIPAIVDHANGTRADNRFSNLRAATPRQNNGNRKINSNSRTGLKGVEYVRRNDCWRATIKLADGRRKALGHFKTPQEAHEAYKQAAVAEFGDFARFQ